MLAEILPSKKKKNQPFTVLPALHSVLFPFSSAGSSISTLEIRKDGTSRFLLRVGGPLLIQGLLHRNLPCGTPLLRRHKIWSRKSVQCTLSLHLLPVLKEHRYSGKGTLFLGLCYAGNLLEDG